MYLATVFGFFAICRKEDGELQIRARVRNDLASLIGSTLVDCDIEATLDKDYPFRIAVSEQELGITLAVLAESIDYSSFRAVIAKRGEQIAKLPAYDALTRSLSSRPDKKR